MDLNHYRGGRTTVSGIAGADLQRNSRAGITLVYPIKSRHAIKLSVSNGVAIDSGGDYRIASLSYLRLIN